MKRQAITRNRPACLLFNQSNCKYSAVLAYTSTNGQNLPSFALSVGLRSSLTQIVYLDISTRSTASPGNVGVVLTNWFAHCHCLTIHTGPSAVGTSMTIPTKPPHVGIQDDVLCDVELRLLLYQDAVAYAPTHASSNCADLKITILKPNPKAPITFTHDGFR